MIAQLRVAACWSLLLAGCSGSNQDTPTTVKLPDTDQPQAAVEALRFASPDGRLVLTYRRGNSTQVVLQRGGETLLMAPIEGNYSSANARFVELNGDGQMDAILELADEIGFEPLIFLSTSDGGYLQALKGIHVTVEYANLDSGPNSLPYEPYDVRGETSAGRKDLVFSHLYIDRKLANNVLLRLAPDGSDYLIAEP